MKRFVSVGSTVSENELTKSVTKFDLRCGGAAAFGARSTSKGRRTRERKRLRSGGLKAFGARREYKSGIYSYEQRSPELPAAYDRQLKKNKAASDFLHAQSPSYRKMISWWIVSAKKEETRMARLAKLISESAKGKRLL